MGAITERVNVGVSAIIERDGKYLLGRRIGGKHGSGEFSFPGGKPDPGESPEQAVLRETEEETGLRFADALPVGTWTYERWPDHGVHYVTLYFMVVGGDGEVDAPVNTEPDKCEGWDWYPADNFPAPLFDGIERVQGMLA